MTGHADFPHGCKHPSKRVARCRHTWWHNDHLETNKQLHSGKAIAPFHKRYGAPSLALSLSISLFSPSPIRHKFIPLRLTSLLVLELPINHCCCLTLPIFPETQGGCCRNWVRHNLQGSRAWLVMILLANSTQWEIGGMGGRGWLGGDGGVGGGPLEHNVTPKKRQITVILLIIKQLCSREWVSVGDSLHLFFLNICMQLSWDRKLNFSNMSWTPLKSKLAPALTRLNHVFGIRCVTDRSLCRQKKKGNSFD